MIILRKSKAEFKSIENVFYSLSGVLSTSIHELPHESKGIWSRVKNILHVIRLKKNFIHISGHDHYLLWWPFKNAILTIHDIEALNRKKGFKRWLFKKLWFDIPISNAKVVTTISEFSKQEIKGIGNYKTPIRVIPNPLPIELTQKDYKFNQACPRILHIGVKQNKNLMRLVQALKGLNCELIIIGNPDAGQLQVLEGSSLKYQIKVGLTNEGVAEEYYRCDLLSFISSYEGFGLPIIEAQTVGRPVITSNVSSMPEVAGEGAYFVNPLDSDEMREGIVRIMADEKLRKDLIKKGFENVKRYNRVEIAEKYNKLYKTIV